MDIQQRKQPCKPSLQLQDISRQAIIVSMPYHFSSTKSNELVGGLIVLFLSLAFHPSSIKEERSDPQCYYEDDAEHKNDSGVLAGPVASLGELEAVPARSLDTTDRFHRWNGQDRLLSPSNGLACLDLDEDKAHT